MYADEPRLGEHAGERLRRAMLVQPAKISAAQPGM